MTAGVLVATCTTCGIEAHTSVEDVETDELLHALWLIGWTETGGRIHCRRCSGDVDVQGNPTDESLGRCLLVAASVILAVAALLWVLAGIADI